MHATTVLWPDFADVPAGLKVWQPEHPADAKTLFPAAAFPFTVGCVGAFGSVPCTV